jgi:cation-transporting ATPase E
VPEGLVLLTTVAFLLAVVTLARRQTLVQELPAVEGLARVDVVCLDKTGTLTHGDIVFDRLQLLGGAPETNVREALPLLAGGPDANATAAAMAAEFAPGHWRRTGGIAFSSARKWSAVTADGHGTWILGAPEMMLLQPADEAQAQARAAADELAAEGRRMLLLARSARQVPGEGSGAGAGAVALPPGLTPAALVVLAERIRGDAAEAVRFFADQGVSVKVISGDNPRTVGAVAAQVGIPGVASAADAVNARGLPSDPARLAEALQAHSTFGRVTPQQKRAIVGGSDVWLSFSAAPANSHQTGAAPAKAGPGGRSRGAIQGAIGGRY